MTANVKMITAEKPSVLKVANAALRFRPAGADATPGAPGAPAAGGGQGERPGQGGAGGGGRGSGEQMKERLTKALSLSKDQQQKLDAIFADTRQQMQALSEPERATKGPRIREAARGRIREILNAEQRAKYDEMSPGEGRGDRGGATSTPGRVYLMDGEKLKAVSLTLGISDGTSTEILRGDLKEGQDVVIGTSAGGKQGGGPSGGGSPRLRL
jgi:HlyD family secretion protein